MNPKFVGIGVVASLTLLTLTAYILAKFGVLDMSEGFIALQPEPQSAPYKSASPQTHWAGDQPNIIYQLHKMGEFNRVIPPLNI